MTGICWLRDIKENNENNKYSLVNKAKENKEEGRKQQDLYSDKIHVMEHRTQSNSFETVLKLHDSLRLLRVLCNMCVGSVLSPEGVLVDSVKQKDRSSSLFPKAQRV